MGSAALCRSMFRTKAKRVTWHVLNKTLLLGEVVHTCETALGRLRQKDRCQVEGQCGVHREFKASWNYSKTSSQKNTANFLGPREVCEGGGLYPWGSMTSLRFKFKCT